VSPTLPALIVTPICPHAMSHRPILLGAESVVEIELCRKNGEVYLTLDGQEGFEMEEGDRLTVGRGPRDVLLVRSPRRDYYSVLRSKLHWGGAGVSGDGR
jgi:NAD+ kinase